MAIFRCYFYAFVVLWLVLPALASSQTTLPKAVGAVVTAKGRVEATSPLMKAARRFSGGETVYLNDTIATDAQGGAKIQLLDDTSFTIGPNSSMVIDEFVYDSGAQAGKVSASILEG